MKNKRLVRFQLILLVLVVGLVVWKSSQGPSPPDGVVVFADMAPGNLYRTGLQVDRESEVVVSLMAAYETDDDGASLATYGWILRGVTRELVWSTEAAELRREGILAELVDTIHLDPGQYDVFYTTLGPTERSIHEAPFLGLTPYWTNYETALYMSISEADGSAAPRALIRKESAQTAKQLFENPIWSTGPVGSREMRTFLFRVRQKVSIQIYAIGELCNTGCDYGWIEDARTGEKEWMMDWENTRAAGGMENNRTFDGFVDLAPGIYRAVYRTNGAHSVSRWEANPPYDPDGWGMTIYGAAETIVSEFDPWIHSEPFIRLTGVGNNEHRMAQFSVNDTVCILISSLGEITSRGQLYDYAWLEDNESGEIVWKMSRENSLPGGGDKSNRVETAFIDVAPGAYTIHFKTDGGHAFDNWSLSKPSHPERWGVAVFSVSEKPLEEDVITIIPSSGRFGTATQAADVTAPGSVDLGESIVILERVGNDADLYSSFELAEETEVYIISQGEIATSGRWDYGWIESVELQERIWEMTLRNTTDAGGDDRNRRFEGSVTLPAGTYKVRYISDLSHAYGDFGDEEPDRPEDWGIRIFYLPN